MTIKDYITAKLKALKLTLSEADWCDIGKNVPLDAEDTPSNIDRAFRSLAVDVLPFYVNQAKSESISENGFSHSVSFDSNGVLALYNWLCGRYGIENEIHTNPTVTFL